jgi:hypothetical protein
MTLRAIMSNMGSLLVFRKLMHAQVWFIQTVVPPMFRLIGYLLGAGVNWTLFVIGYLGGLFLKVILPAHKAVQLRERYRTRLADAPHTDQNFPHGTIHSKTKPIAPNLRGKHL